MAGIDLGAIDDRISKLNTGFRSLRMKVQIERRGDTLNLRGTFPPKPGSDRLNPYQQRLSLSIPATPQGLKQVEQEAKIIAGQLTQKSFSWKQYLAAGAGKKLSQLNLGEKIQAFEQHFLDDAKRQRNLAATKTTWNAAYLPYLKKLRTIGEQSQHLTLVEALYKTINSTEANSRSRQLCCTAFNAFAQFLELDLPKPLKELSGEYNHSHTQARQLPTDAEILAAWQQIPNPAWQFVYGIMATYGLRNHEVFFCDYQSLQWGENSIQVLASTKTGSHEVWPFYPDWIEVFDLKNVRLPKVETDLSQTTLQRIGQRVTAQFRRYGVPFSPYDLRHAWAIRTIHVGLPDTVAAKMMGHSVAIHTKTYHQWITHRDQQQAVEAALKRSGLS
jgi:integrase